MTMNLLVPENPTSIIQLLAAFYPAGDKKNFPQRAAMSLHNRFVEETLANALNFCVCAEKRL